MSSIATVYFCDSDALQSLVQLFARSLKTKPEERRILDFMRFAASSVDLIKYQLLVLRGFSRLLTSEYVDRQLAVSLFRECLRKVSRETLKLVEVQKVGWSPTSRGQITVDGVKLPVSSIDLENVLKLQEEYGIVGFVVARL